MGQSSEVERDDLMRSTRTILLDGHGRSVGAQSIGTIIARLPARTAKNMDVVCIYLFSSRTSRPSGTANRQPSHPKNSPPTGRAARIQTRPSLQLLLHVVRGGERCLRFPLVEIACRSFRFGALRGWRHGGAARAVKQAARFSRTTLMIEQRLSLTTTPVTTLRPA